MKYLAQVDWVMSNAASWLKCIILCWLFQMKVFKHTALGSINGTRFIIRAGCHRWPLLEVVILNLPLIVGSGLMSRKGDTLTIILLDVFSKSGEATHITITTQVLSEDFHGRVLACYFIGSGPILFMIAVACYSLGSCGHRRFTFIFLGHLFSVFAELARNNTSIELVESAH